MIWALINLETDQAIATSDIAQDTTPFEYLGGGILYQWQQRESVELPTEPNWNGFIAEFLVPGNAFYDSVWSKVKAAGYDAIDHWDNLKTQLIDIQNPDTFCAAIAFLAQLLNDAGHPLTQDDLDGLNTRLTNNNFPLTCLLWL